MKYSINELDALSVDKICAGLAELPFKDVYMLLPYIQNQLKLQQEAAAETQITAEPDGNA